MALRPADIMHRFAADRKPITQLMVVPEWNCLLSISNGGLSAHSLDCVRIGSSGTSLLPESAVPSFALTPIQLPSAARGATQFAVGARECATVLPMPEWLWLSLSTRFLFGLMIRRRNAPDCDVWGQGQPRAELFLGPAKHNGTVS